MSVQIDYVSDDGGDWEGVFLNGTRVYDGHSIPVFVWLALFRTIEHDHSFEKIEIREWESKLEAGGRYPNNFLDIIEELKTE